MTTSLNLKAMLSRKRVNKRVADPKRAVTEKRPLRQNRFKNRALTKDKSRKFEFNRLFQIILCSAALFLASVTLIFIHDLFTQADFFDIQTIEVTGINQIAVKDVIQESNVQVGDNLLNINLNLIRKRLLAHPWIEDVQVSRTIPDKLLISVMEYKPEAIVNIEDKNYIISDKGILFKSLTDADPKNLPVVTGLSYTDIPVADLTASKQFQAIRKVLAMGRKKAALIPIHKLQKIRTDSELGLTLEAFDPSILIQIGYDHYPQKYENLKRALGYLRDENMQLQVNAIDLRDPDQVVVTPIYSNQPHQS